MTTKSVANRRILGFSRAFYFDETSGAAVANRCLLEHLCRWGFSVEAL